VNMAQNYLGSNNMNLLQPNGQFGTRLKGGEDSASERYIFTLLNPLTRYVFPEADDMILDYINDDGQFVEPTFYAPIIPFCLVNGISGIGTGFSCNIPSYNPMDLINYLRLKLRNTDPMMNFVPYYEGFKGTVKEIEPTKYLIKGLYEKIDNDKIVITELPVGTWTMNYLSFLEDLMESDKKKKTSSIVKDFVNISTEIHVHITIQFEKGKLAELECTVDNNGVNGLEKILKLSTTISTTNMNMFNENKQLHKYKNVREIIDAFYDVRMEMYDKRKNAQVRNMKVRVQELSNRARFIQEVVSNTIDLRKYADDNEMETALAAKKYDKQQDKYDYLTHMAMHNMNKARVQKILQEKEELIKELEKLEKKQLITMWLNELDVLEREYGKYKELRKKILESSVMEGTQKKIKKTKK